MFVLCMKCAELNNQERDCECEDEQRMIKRGVYVTEELKLAVSKGYKIIRFYEVYHYPGNSDNTLDEFTGENANLFSSYVKEFLKIKQAASGYPTECVDRDKYISDY